MAKTGAAAQKFLDELIKGIQPKFAAEVEEMRKLKGANKESCRHRRGFSSSSISRIVARLEEELENFARRRLEKEYSSSGAGRCAR